MDDVDVVIALLNEASDSKPEGLVFPQLHAHVL